MAQPFKRIVIYGRHRSGTHGFRQTLQKLEAFLQLRQVDLYIEEETAQFLDGNTLPTVSLTELSQRTDLLIVIGGDGSLLSAAKAAIQSDTPVLGINRGRLGFLADIRPDDIEQQIGAILDGHYLEEERFLLDAMRDKTLLGCALNDIVLMPGDIAHMIEFSLFVNEQLVCTQRADGLIIATPTGSTAYALSGGGPILHPSLDAVVLVPMFSHTLSSRPIVLDAKSAIKLVIDPINEAAPYLSCDGHERECIQPGESIHIQKKKERLTLLHPTDYNYYETLRSKLGWQAKY